MAASMLARDGGHGGDPATGLEVHEVRPMKTGAKLVSGLKGFAPPALVRSAR